MKYVTMYAGVLLVFLPVDAIWLKTVMNPLFRSQVGDLMTDAPHLGVAAIFYLFYIAAIVFLAVVPALKTGNWQLAMINGAILGLAAYGTYEATNMATLKGWTWTMIVVDVTWGTFLTAISALGGFAAAKLINIG